MTTFLHVRGRAVSIDFACGAGVAALLVAVALITQGGVALAPNTWTQLALVIAGAGVAIALLALSPRGHAWGAGAVILFAALAALTYASIAWSVQPATSWLEANRTVSYLAVFGAVVGLARIAPGRWRAVVGGIATAATLISAYALLIKVFPRALDPNDPLGRLMAPFAYWNATGLIAAMGLPACLWAGARREHAPVLRALSVPAIAILVPALLLSYSRGALVAAVLGTALWFAFVPLRLRAIVTLTLGAAGGGGIAAWALATHSISADGVPMAARASAGHAFGLVLVVVMVLAVLAGFAAGFATDRFAPAAQTRHRIGTVLVALVALVPVGGVVALAVSSRGLTGQISHIWSTVTNPNGVVGDKPGRLVQLSNSRPRYWREGLKIGEHHLIAGAGALGFATAHTRYANDTWNVQHAHSYPIETFADFGLIGVVLSLALLVAWAAAARRSLGLDGSVRGAARLRAPPGAESEGMFTLLAVVVIFGLHSLIDWTWFIPGTAIVALVAAGWLAGRGPLARPVGRLASRRQLSRSPAAVAAAAAAIGLTVACAWVIAQPLRSSDSYTAALTAVSRGDTGTALTDAREAAASFPVSVDPLFLESAIYTGLRNPRAARSELLQAASLQPQNPVTWQHLGCYDLHRLRAAAAARELRRAYVLEPGQTQLRDQPAVFCSAYA